MGQGRAAHPENLERRARDAEFRLKGDGHIDLSEDAEALGRQRNAHRPLGAVDGLVDERCRKSTSGFASCELHKHLLDDVDRVGQPQRPRGVRGSR